MVSGTIWAPQERSQTLLETLYDRALGPFWSAQDPHGLKILGASRVPLLPPDLPNSIHMASNTILSPQVIQNHPQAFKDLWKQPEGGRRQGA